MIEHEYMNELYHHGTKGQKWGVRRYQNKDGSLTAEGKKRRSLGEVIKDHKVKVKRKAALEKARKTKAENKAAEEKAKAEAEQRRKDFEAGKIPMKKMTNAELSEALARKQMEAQYRQKDLETNAGKRLVSKMWNDGIVPGMADGVKGMISGYIKDSGAQLLGLDKLVPEKEKSAFDKLKESAEMAKLKKQKFQDERDLAEAKKKYEKHLQDEKDKKSAEQVKNYNEKREKDYQEEQTYKSGAYNNKGTKIYVDDAEVVGEGTSSKQYKDRHGHIGNSKSSDYYDPIDVEGKWVDDTPISGVPATVSNDGRRYLERYLLEG